jgi:hypothetical protein
VAQGIGPEFELQYHKKKERKRNQAHDENRELAKLFKI